MNTKEMDEKYVIHTYGRWPITIVKGKGVYLWDEEGKKYLDMISGIGVCSLGYSHPSIIKTIAEQSKRLMHVSNLYYTEPQPILAKELVESSGMKKAFFCNSGTESNEAAIKLAKKHTGKTKFIAFDRSFHGRTSGSLALTWKKKYRESFKPLMPGVSFATYNDFDSVKKLVDKDTAAIIVEPVQGEGGIIPAKPEFLKGLRKICSEKKIVLIFDEVQSAFRTGNTFAFQTLGVTPDIVTMAKALGAGFPIGAMLAGKGFENTFVPGDHASTFGGNPLACSVSLTALKEMKSLIPKAKEKGKYFMSLLNSINSSLITEVRGLGLMIGMELVTKEERDSLVNYCRSNGLIICGSGEKTARFLPPLIITKKELKNAYEILKGFFS